MTLTYDNATHLLRCRHAIGRNGRTYFMRCHIVGKCREPNHLRVLVWGERDRAGYEHKSRRRTVRKERVTERPQ